MRFRSLLVFLSFTLSLVIVGDSAAQESNGPTDTATLKEVVGNRLKIGVGVGEQILAPENCMKPQCIHPAEDRWNFAAPDRFVAFASQNNLEGVGHCLVWAKDDRTDKWMKSGKDGNAVSRAELLARIEGHVATGVPSETDP
ncbi:endo-1,4-beta-xylanase [Stieleria maiorica]|uniref:endo-1,4-beta-xylanase n=1 Tax=Stieleria maiorica TaxID=2795974 RepID=UPI001F45190F|nr:endo-1,4-beta-xylanase [Stieleria maiorica]